jgi:hypothetical protein
MVGARRLAVTVAKRANNLTKRLAPGSNSQMVSFWTEEGEGEAAR